MTLLPIVERELRVAARRRGFYRGRLAVATLALVVASAVHWMGRSEPAPELGMALFAVLSALTLCCALLTGAVFTADALSAEHREGTLGLLFLTDLKGHDIILGKLAAGAVPALFSLLAALPVIGLTVVFGGVTGAAVWQMSLALLAGMFFSLALGITVSVWFEDARKALVVTLAVAVLMTLGPWALSALLNRGLPVGYDPDLLLCPALPFLGVLENVMRPFLGGTALPLFSHRFWLSLGSITVFSGLLLVLASFALQRSWHERTAAWGDWGRARFRRLGSRSSTSRRLRRSRLLDANPYLWLNLRRPGRRVVAWSAFALMALVAAYAYLTEGAHWIRESGYLVLPIIGHLGVSIGLVLAAGQQLSEDRRSGGLELLLSTPLSRRLMLAGQMSALRRLYGSPVLVILATDVLLAVLHTPHAGSDPWVFLGFVVGGMAVLVADCVTMAWLAVWAALRRGGALRAAGATLTRVWLLPWGMLLAALVLAHVFEAESGVSDGAALAAWLVTRLGINAYWLQLARRRMEGRFQSVADGEPPLGNRLWRWLTLQ